MKDACLSPISHILERLVVQLRGWYISTIRLFCGVFLQSSENLILSVVRRADKGGTHPPDVPYHLIQIEPVELRNTPHLILHLGC